jgi:hypothetical protein
VRENKDDSVVFFLSVEYEIKTKGKGKIKLSGARKK